MCGIRNKTLIINFPGSKKAVVECFESIQSVLPHAIQLIRDEKAQTTATHENVQRDFKFPTTEKKFCQGFPQVESDFKEPANRDQEESMDFGSTISEASEITNLLNESSSSMQEVSFLLFGHSSIDFLYLQFFR